MHYARARRKQDPVGNKRRIRAYKLRQDDKKVKEAGRPRPDTCEVCRELHIRVVFDHCHATGVFRGWICDRCNRVLGLCYDDPELLNKLAKYLRRNGNVKANLEAQGRPSQLGLRIAS